MKKKLSLGLLREAIIWAGTYRLYAEIAKKGNLLASLLLVEHIQKGSNYSEELDEEGLIEKKAFDDMLEESLAEYNPKHEIAALDNTLLCFEISTESYLYPKLGERICGKYKGMSNELSITKLLNEETGLYEDETINILIEIAYPTASDLLRLSVLDFEEVEAFT